MSAVNRLCLVVLALAVIALASSAAAVHISSHPELILAAPMVGPATQMPSAGAGIPYFPRVQLQGDPLGQTYLVGTTWYDYQHNGSISKTISLTPSRGVHVIWMNGFQAQAADRHIFYNYFNPTTGALGWPDIGYQVDQGDRGGYTCLDHLSSGEVVVFMHTNPTPTSDWTATVAWDFLEGFGAFQINVLPIVPAWGNLAWPHGTVDAQDYIHLVAHENRTEVWQRLAYARSEDNGATFTEWVALDTIVTLSGDMSASPVSNKVGIACTKSMFDVINLGPYDGLLVSQLNNTISLVESDDGVTWDFLDRRDLLNLVEPDTSRYPDSTWANGDTLRCYCDVSLLYDYNDYAHAAFTTRYLGFDARLAAHPDSFAVTGISLDASMIWHWSEEHDTLTLVADGWYDIGSPNAGANESRGSGAWRSTVDRPSLGINPDNGYLYCTYQRCVEGDTSGGNIPSHGFANGEIFCSVSTDGGLNWSEPTNLTNTPSPGALPGSCMDEDYSSLARVVNDTLHILYVEDKDAGGVVQTAPQEGIWTENPVKYLKVPADLVTPGPPYVSNFEFHVGPSPNLTEPTLVDGAVPSGYALHQNYPNPFNPDTEIRYAVAEDVPVTLRIYNVRGAQVATLVDRPHQAGTYTVRWEAGDLASGVYFCRLEAGAFSASRKMVLLR